MRRWGRREVIVSFEMNNVHDSYGTNSVAV
jgi:hypothetical protein